MEASSANGPSTSSAAENEADEVSMMTVLTALFGIWLMRQGWLAPAYVACQATKCFLVEQCQAFFQGLVFLCLGHIVNVADTACISSQGLKADNDTALTSAAASMGLPADPSHQVINRRCKRKKRHLLEAAA